MFIRTRNVTRVRLAGRWCSDLTLSYYLQEAVSSFVLCSIPEDALDLVESIRRLYSEEFRRPPLRGWWKLFSRAKQVRQVEAGLRLAREMRRS